MAAKLLKLWFSLFFLVCFTPGSSLVKLNKETKEFIRLVIENSNGQVICFSSGPVRAIPRGTRVRNAVGDSPSAFLVPDILLWDPLLHFPELVLLCPSCDEKNTTQETLKPIRWKDGSKDYDQPRLLYGLRNDVLLVGRVYLCRNKHQILSHDQGILCQLRADFQPPFLLFHKIGVTRELFRFFTSHISAGMTICDVQVLWHQSLFDEYGIRKMCFLTEKNKSPETFPGFSPKGSKVGEKVSTCCYIMGYFEKEHLYHRRMCQMRASSLSADHTFKVSANIGFWCEGKWIQLYDSLFIVMNEVGIVLAWKLCKGTGFDKVEDLLTNLKDRLSTKGCIVDHFYIENCCQWRHKLNTVFDGVSIKLDPFHAIQRVVTKIPKKGGRGPLQKLRTQMQHDFKLILRDPTDRGMKRSKPTPSASVIEKNIDNFLIQWKSVEYEGTKVLPQSAITEIDKLLLHVRKGCLSDIPPSGGTSRNEGIHRVLNKTLKKSRLGIQFALALLGIFFYMWNEKHIRSVEDQKKIRVTPPIESYFEHLESSNKATIDYCNFQATPGSLNGGESGYTGSNIEQADNEVTILDKLNVFLDATCDNLNMSSDEDEPSDADCISAQAHLPPLSEKQRDSVINSSKCMANLCQHIESLSQCAKLNPNFMFFTKSSLTLFHSGLVSSKEPSTLDNVISNHNMVRVSVPPNGNCFFLSVAHSIMNSIIPNVPVSSALASHLDSLGLMTCNDQNEMSSRLRELTVHEWMSHPEEYQPFIGTEQTVNHEALLFLADGHFASDLGNSMPLAMANLLKLPLVVISQMESLPVIPITPRETIYCLPIFIAFDHSGSGHYDALAHITGSQSPSDCIKKPSSCDNKDTPSIEGCRCGQGARKKQPNITSCDSFKKRCKCFQSVCGCSDTCQCIGCENPHGKKAKKEERSYPTQVGSRKRRSHELTTEGMSGKQFLLKRPHSEYNVSKWTFLEELVLIHVIQLNLTKGGSDIDIGAIASQYSQLVDNNSIYPKSHEQITRKVISFLNDNKVFQTLLREQVRLNWF